MQDIVAALWQAYPRFKEKRLHRAGGQLRPLAWMQSLQGLLGVGLIVLGVACWTANLHVPGLLLAGLLVHALGLAHVIFAGLTLAWVARGRSLCRLGWRAGRCGHADMGLDQPGCRTGWIAGNVGVAFSSVAPDRPRPPLLRRQ
jgi:hypothetical protein